MAEGDATPAIQGNGSAQNAQADSGSFQSKLDGLSASFEKATARAIETRKVMIDGQSKLNTAKKSPRN